LSLFVDTSVWSLAFRRGGPVTAPEVVELARAIRSRDLVLSTGFVLQEILQGAAGPRFRSMILEQFDSVPLLEPARDDYVEAAELRNNCRRAGVQVETVDALLAQLCISRDLVLLTTDKDFQYVARHTPLKIWKP
jgi:predicted nucleic acid-binding protein